MRIHIIHTNDLHGHLERWDILSAYIQKRKEELTHSGEAFILCDIGDAMDTVHPLVEASHGKIMVDLFNELGYDLVTIGNNEGLNFTPQGLKKVYAQADYQVVCANLLDAQTSDLPEWAVPYKILTVNDKTIAFIGMTAPYQTYLYNGYQALDIYDCLYRQLERIQNSQSEIDVIVLMSHLGLSEDRLIAAKFPQIDVILGAHTHHVLVEGEWVNQTLLAACGRYGEFVGEVTLDFQPDRLEKEVRVLSIEQVMNIMDMELTEAYHQRGRKELSKIQLASLPHSLYARLETGQQSLIQTALDAVCEYTYCDLAFLSTGLFLQDLPEGPVTANDLHHCLPHPVHLARLSIEGQHLVTLLEEIHQQEDDLEYKLIAGNGFRGKVFGRMIFRGLQYDPEQAQWLVMGQPIKSDSTYQVICLDHYWFLPFFPTIHHYGNPVLLFPEFLRHILAGYLKEHYPLLQDNLFENTPKE